MMSNNMENVAPQVLRAVIKQAQALVQEHCSHTIYQLKEHVKKKVAFLADSSRLLNSHLLAYQTVPSSIFNFLSLGTPKSKKSRKSLYFLYLLKINIYSYISKICKKKKVRGKWYFCCTYLFDETSIENSDFWLFWLFWGPKEKN